MGNEDFQLPNAFPFSYSSAQHRNPSTSADAHLPQSPALSQGSSHNASLPSPFSSLGFVPMFSPFVPCFFPPNSYFTSSTSPQFSESFLQGCLWSFPHFIPPGVCLLSFSRQSPALMPLGQFSSLNDTITDCPFPKTKRMSLGQILNWYASTWLHWLQGNEQAHNSWVQYSALPWGMTAVHHTVSWEVLITPVMAAASSA